MNTNFEIYRLCCNTIREELKDKCVGYVRVGVEPGDTMEQDTLVISIAKGDTLFLYTKVNCIEYIMYTNVIVNDVMTQYKRFIKNKYFK